MVQEGLTNIGKHAKASQASVTLGFRERQMKARHRRLVLTIEDNGCGAIDPVAATDGDGAGLGLIGMRERAAALGGELDVVQLDRGFRLQAVIPIGAGAEAPQ
jgi:signal transduction histidine kinase